MKFCPLTRNNTYLGVFVVAMMVTITAGWLLTGFLGRVAEKEFEAKVDREAQLTVSLLNDNLEDTASAAKSLSPAEVIVAALATGSAADLEGANRLLDRIKSSFDMSVCYLLDKNGLAIASSNRNEKINYIGKSFAARPYFTGALAGRLTEHFALGVYSRERGYFVATPVVSSAGSIAGVVVVKRNVAPVEEFFKKYDHAFLVSPEGIIFISSSEELRYRSLWPIDETGRAALQASAQFGAINFDPLLAAEPRNGSYVGFAGKKHYLQRLPFGSDGCGWTLVLMDESGVIANYRLFGILLTAVFVLLLLFFYSILLYKNRSLETARDLLKSRDDWKRTFDNVPDLIAIIDANDRIVSMNRAMAERLGVSPNEAVGRHCCELIHGSQELPPSCPHRGMVDSGSTEAETLFGMKLNGDFIVTATPLLTEEGTMESTIHVMHDITELKKLERSLKEYAQRLEFVLEGSNDATWEWDLITNQGILNKRYYEMTEYTAGEVDSTFEFFLKTIHPEDAPEVQRRVQDTLEGKTGEYEAHYRMVTKSGGTRDVMGRGKIVRFDEDDRPIKMAGVVTDVTEMKRLGEEVNRISKLESIGLLAGGLAHDFNNVLNAIYGNISFAKMLAGDNTSIIEPLSDAEEACERAKELGIRLQTFSQENSPVKESITLAVIIENVTGALFKGSNISHTISATEDVFPLEANPRQIRQVFENLLTNAKEAVSDDGTVTVNIESYEVDGKKMLPLRSGLYVRITIKDNGKGIPTKNLPKIFDPYFSTKDTYSQKGLGLGLSICHAILKQHDGHISVESKVGVGTEVTMYLPALVEATKPSAGE